MNGMRMTGYGVLLVTIFSLLSGMAWADRDHHGDDRDHDRRERHEHRDRGDRDYRHYYAGAPVKDYRRDRRYERERYYPRPGVRIEVLPSRHYVVRYHDDRYYFHAGTWYRPFRGRFVVVAPPIGIVVPILPAYYTTIWYQGVPYYYANNTYYIWDPARDGYVVTNPPPQVNDQDTTLLPQQLYIYPKQGQSKQQQANDRFACYQWSVKQTGFDPTQPPEQMSQDQLNEKRADYRRAMRACLEGRGYSVR